MCICVCVYVCACMHLFTFVTVHKHCDCKNALPNINFTSLLPHTYYDSVAIIVVPNAKLFDSKSLLMLMHMNAVAVWMLCTQFEYVTRAIGCSRRIDSVRDSMNKKKYGLDIRSSEMMHKIKNNQLINDLKNDSTHTHDI